MLFNIFCILCKIGCFLLQFCYTQTIVYIFHKNRYILEVGTSEVFRWSFENGFIKNNYNVKYKYEPLDTTKH